MKMETLRVTWKYIRWNKHGRTPTSYAHYIIENHRHKHTLKVWDGSKLFELLKNNRIYKNREVSIHEILVDGIYDKEGQLMYVTNFRKI